MRKKEVGDRIRQIRNHFNLTQKKFSRAIGMSQGHYSKIESGAQEPSKTLILAMMARFAANPIWIKTGKGEMLVSTEQVISKGITLLGAKQLSEDLANALKDPRLAEFQAFITMDKLRKEQNDGELQQLLQQVAKLWHQGDERTRKILAQLVKAVGEDEGREKGKK